MVEQKQLEYLRLVVNILHFSIGLDDWEDFGPAEQLRLDLHDEVGLGEGDGALAFLVVTLAEVLGPRGLVDRVHRLVQFGVVGYHFLERVRVDDQFAHGFHFLGEEFELFFLL